MQGDKRRFFMPTMEKLTRRLFYMLLTPHQEVRLIFGHILPTRMSSSWLLDVIQAYAGLPCSSQGQGRTIEKIQPHPIYQTLGPERAAALPAFHALSGADNAGCFSGKGKATCWKAFMEADDEITDCLSQLGGTASTPSDDTIALIEKLVCQLYLPKTEMPSVSEMGWWLFRKKQAQSERLPPT